MDATPAQALQSITSISKVIENSLPEALNFDGANAFKPGAAAALMQGGQPKKGGIGDLQFPPMDINGLISDTKGSYPGLIDDLHTHILGEIMRMHGPNPTGGVNYTRPAEGTGQNRSTPFFQPQDQRGPVPSAANNFQFAQLQGWNPPAT